MAARCERESAIGSEREGRELKERDEGESMPHASKRGEIAPRQERPYRRHRREKAEPEALAPRERDAESGLSRAHSLAVNKKGEKEGDKAEDRSDKEPASSVAEAERAMLSSRACVNLRAAQEL